MKRRARERTGAAGALIAGIVFLAPAAWNTAKRHGSPTDAPARLEDTREHLRETELAAEVTRLREELDAAARMRIEPAGIPADAARYSAQLADVLPFADPSGLRSAIWVYLPQSPAPPEDSALVYQRALAGRLMRAFPGGIAQAQTLLDRGFRVRYRCGEQSGILAGTGRRDAQPPFLPLLEAIHTTPLGALAPDALVYTSGGDGIFPAGLLIGRVAAEEVEITGNHQMVTAALCPDDLRSVVVVCDAARRAFSAALESER
ncbi:MAG: rod shape-determining protein MreC [Planctomycetes bacterium]|nr:rod shape-determining protein MreC [Planctomycetota bacterium]